MHDAEEAIANISGRLVRRCLLYTSDAADERSSVDLGGRRIIKKKKNTDTLRARAMIELRSIRLERVDRAI